MKKIIFIFIVLFAQFAHAYDFEKGFNPEIKIDCPATPNIEPDTISFGEINKSNNLIRKAGAARRAQGHYVRIHGKIVDANCAPVQGAVVKIWQADHAGKYEHQYQLKSEWDVRDESYDKYFAYSGTARTDNLGHFSFVTILPGIDEVATAPHINFSVTHDDFEQLNTRMYFNKHPRNDIDSTLKELTPEQRNMLKAKGQKLDPTGNLEGRIYTFEIALPGLNKHVGY